MLLWIDLETTGLNPKTDYICEVAWCITTNSTTIVTDIRNAVVDLSPAARAKLIATDEVFRMHRKSGLLDDLFDSDEVLRLEDIEDQILHVLPSTDDLPMVAGFSVHFDLSFINEYMPRLAARLSHRVFDVSTIKTFFQAQGYYAKVPNLRKHRADSDVVEALEVARTYRDIVSYSLSSWMEPTHA